MRPNVSLFFPMYNEVDSIELITQKAIDVLSNTGRTFEVLIVDDGSSDGSSEKADDLAIRDPRVRVIHHSGNRGYGAALRTGFNNANGDIVAYTDCDEPADLRLFADALPLLDTYDLVIGYREGRNDGLQRLVFTKGYNQLVRTLFGVRVRDINFSFKLIRRSALERMRLTTNTVFIDGEFLIEAKRCKLGFVEVPVRYQSRVRGTANFGNIGAATATFREMFRYWLDTRVLGVR